MEAIDCLMSQSEARSLMRRMQKFSENSVSYIQNIGVCRDVAFSSLIGTVITSIVFFRLVTSRAPLWSWVLRILWYVQTTPQSSAVYKPSGPTSSSCGPQRGRPPSINLPVSPASFCLHRPRGTPNPHRTPHSLHYILQANNEWPEGKLRDDSLRLTLTQRLCFLHISTGLNI